MGEVYLGASEIAARVNQLGTELAADYAGREPLLVGTLKASFVFLTDLSRALPILHAIDFVELARGTGYDPVLSTRMLERFQSELRDLRARLIRLTLSGQKDYARRGAIPHTKRKAA